MNTAACLISQPDVLSPEPAISPESAEPEVSEVPSPPLRENISLRVPSGRDLEIYQEVVSGGMTQRRAAKKHGISQPRVHQIVQEMTPWMADNTPELPVGLAPPQLLRLAYHTRAIQLRHLFETLMAAWEESQVKQPDIRTSIAQGGHPVAASKGLPQGDPRYLRQAERVSEAIFRLTCKQAAEEFVDAPRKSRYWEAEEEDGVRGQETAEADLSTWAERAAQPNPTSEEMDAITGEQEAVFAALQSEVQQLKGAQREVKNTLSRESVSLGTGPLLPEDKRDTCRRRKQAERRDFLRGDPPRLTIQEYIGPVAQATG
ncbi:MAG: hypothetical protein IAF94_27190 [Pirellulaceae bacterium]|nr:hypothetical protein [Pirellulaceae bacterium]